MNLFRSRDSHQPRIAAKPRGLRYLVAVAIGATVPFLTGFVAPQHGTANATVHCTRYAPTNVVDPANCSAFNSVSSGVIYTTSSNAIRDNNYILASSSQYLGIDYHETSGVYDGFVNDWSTSLSYGASSGYAYSECWFDVSTSGNCHTGWRN